MKKMNVIITDLNQTDPDHVIVGTIDREAPLPDETMSPWPGAILFLLMMNILMYYQYIQPTNLPLLFFIALLTFTFGLILSSGEHVVSFLAERTPFLVRLAFYCNVCCVILFWVTFIFGVTMNVNTDIPIGMSGALGGLGYGMTTTICGFWASRLFLRSHFAFPPETLLDFGNREFRRLCIFAGIANAAFPFHSSLLSSTWEQFLLDLIFIAINVAILLKLSGTMIHERMERFREVMPMDLMTEVEKLTSGHFRSFES